MSRLRTALHRRLDHVSDMGWFNLVGLAIFGFFLLLALMPLRDGVDSMRAEKWGIRGTFAADRCAIDEWAKGKPWRCHGAFTSEDGALRISGVRYEYPFDVDPRPTGGAKDLDALVAGPGSAKAWPPGDEWQASLIVGAFALVVAVLVLIWWVNPGSRRTSAAASPASGRRGRRKERVRRWGGGQSSRRV